MHFQHTRIQEVPSDVSEHTVENRKKGVGDFNRASRDMNVVVVRESDKTHTISNTALLGSRSTYPKLLLNT